MKITREICHRILRSIKRAGQYGLTRQLKSRRIKRDFKAIHGYPLNLKAPRSLSEKINWIKLYRNLKPLAPFVDKYTVRGFVADRIGKEYLIPLVGLFHRFDDINIDRLPGAFVLKATHGSGWNIIVKDKKAVDWRATGRIVDEWLHSDYALISGEENYCNINGRIMIEDYLQDAAGRLDDLKFYCCNGEPLGLHVDIDRFVNHGYRIYDAHWNEFVKTKPPEKDLPQIPRPDNLKELLEICRKLSAGFSFVRVDLYNVDGRIYFGELTFTPGSGMSSFDPVESDYYFGEPLDVRRYIGKLQRL